jgi:hypothetical protein
MTVNRQLEACKANDSTRHEAVSLGIERRAGVRTFFPAAAEEFEVRRLQLEKAWLQILSGVLCQRHQIGPPVSLEGGYSQLRDHASGQLENRGAYD